MSRPPAARAVILFDGVCGLCNTAAGWVRTRDRNGLFEFLPLQAEEARRRFPGLDPEAMHLVLSDGTVHSGADAFAWILRELPGWRWAALIFKVPGVRLAARPAYAWIARHRPRATCDSGRTTPSPPPSAP